jgi:16S rRNA processing protein RimM
MDQELVCVASLQRPHGVHGEVLMKIFTEDPHAIVALSPLMFVSQTENSISVEKLRPAKEGFVAQLKGIGSRTEAENIGKGLLFVPRDRLPQLQEEDSFYHVDLEDLEVRAIDGTKIGQVVRVLNFGAGDLLELVIEGKKQTVVIPFTQDAVPVVDVTDGYIQIGSREMTGLDR